MMICSHYTTKQGPEQTVHTGDLYIFVEKCGEKVTIMVTLPKRMLFIALKRRFFNSTKSVDGCGQISCCLQRGVKIR